MVISRPDKFFLVAAYAEGPTPLNAFDNALMKAGIGNTNLLRISSILPPGAQQIPAAQLPYGSLVPTAYAEETSETVGERISAAVACGVPEDATLPGVIMEHHMSGDEAACREAVLLRVREAFAARGYSLKSIHVASASGVIQRVGSAVAAVVLWS